VLPLFCQKQEQEKNVLGSIYRQRRSDCIISRVHQTADLAVSKITNLRLNIKSTLLQTLAPTAWPTLHLLFDDWNVSARTKNLKTFPSSQVGDLLMFLQYILFSPQMNHPDLLLFVIINLMHRIACILQSGGLAAGLQPDTWLQLQEDCSNCYYSDPEEHWRKTRTLFLDLWIALIQAE